MSSICEFWSYPGDRVENYSFLVSNCPLEEKFRFIKKKGMIYALAILNIIKERPRSRLSSSASKFLLEIFFHLKF